MSALAIVSGALGKAAELRTSKNGNPFATFPIRENVNGVTRWWQGISFSETAIEVLKELSVGEPIAVAGEITAEIYAPAGSESRINWRITVESVLSARKPPKAKPESTGRKPNEAKGRRDRAEAAPSALEPRPGRNIASKSWAAPARAEIETPRGSAPVGFDDAIPFFPEWR
jgi:single-stranded DNA-binding protein